MGLSPRAPGESRGEKKHGPPTASEPPPVYSTPFPPPQGGKLSCILDDEEVKWNVRILIADVKLAFRFIYTPVIVTQDLIFHCIFSSVKT